MTSENTKGLRAQVEHLITKYGFQEPDRGDLDDPNTLWRSGKPDYTEANYRYLCGKTQIHKQGSLEEIVENLVKTWEMEASHKIDMNQWTTINHDDYTLQVNGEEVIDGKTAFEIGNYGALLKNCPAYNKLEPLNFEESHALFRNTFTEGFPWELLKVLAGPPHVVFTWRHWGIFNGEYLGRKGNGELMELYGMCRVIVNQSLKITKIEVFYDPQTFLEALEGTVKLDECKYGKALIGDITTLATEKLDCTKNINKCYGNKAEN